MSDAVFDNAAAHPAARSDTGDDEDVQLDSVNAFQGAGIMTDSMDYENSDDDMFVFCALDSHSIDLSSVLLCHSRHIHAESQHTC